MTAPDPGLTDLIAAALGDKIMHTNGSGDRNRAYAAHVALVVEQHTNGRTAELEARVDEWSAEYRKGIQARDNWRARAEKAEATIARVRNALPNIEGINPASSHYDKGWDRGQQILTEHIQSAITGDYTRAALEGEQQ